MAKTEMNLENLGVRFYLNSLVYAKGRGYILGDDSNYFIEERCFRAAEDILNQNFNGDIQGNTIKLIKKADRAFEAFIDEMIFAAETIPNYLKNGGPRLGEQTLGEAQISLCPLWPIC